MREAIVLRKNDLSVTTEKSTDCFVNFPYPRGFWKYQKYFFNMKRDIVLVAQPYVGRRATFSSSPFPHFCFSHFSCNFRLFVFS